MYGAVFARCRLFLRVAILAPLSGLSRSGLPARGNRALGSRYPPPPEPVPNGTAGPRARPGADRPPGRHRFSPRSRP